MESGTPGVKVTEDGWLNRALQAEALAGKPTAFRAVALGTQVPRTLQGKVPAIAVNNLADFSVGGKGPQTSPIRNAFQAMYDESSDAVLHGTGQETFEAVKMLKAADPAKYQPAAGVEYPNTPFGNSLKQVAQLMKANLGVEAAFSDIGGWDTHQNQGNVNGQLANRLTGVLGDDCGLLEGHGDGCGERDAGDDVGVWPDGPAERHGWDGPWSRECDVRAGRAGEGREGLWEVAGAGERAVERRAGLAVTTDFRRVLGEAAYKTLGARNLDWYFREPGESERIFQLWLDSLIVFDADYRRVCIVFRNVENFYLQMWKIVDNFSDGVASYRV